jgi:hypothetical protein
MIKVVGHRERGPHVPAVYTSGGSDRVQPSRGQANILADDLACPRVTGGCASLELAEQASVVQRIVRHLTLPTAVSLRRMDGVPVPAFITFARPDGRQAGSRSQTIGRRSLQHQASRLF